MELSAKGEAISQLPAALRDGAPDAPDAAAPQPRVVVAVDAPQHSGLGGAARGLLEYLAATPVAPGTLVRVPLGRRTVTGIVWEDAGSSGAAGRATPAPVDPGRLRPLAQVLGALPPLPADWRRLVAFAAGYYQRGIGELALAVLPPELRRLDDAALARRLARLPRAVAATSAAATERPPLTDEQASLLAEWPRSAAPTLLWGVTGSGKTELYLRIAESVLAAGRQVLVLVPEINLTPQLEARFAARFPGRRLVSLHSGLGAAARLRHWLLAQQGDADLVLGTRMAVFAPLPRLGAIVVDEEHDPSFKQQEGARYSARDLAVWRAHDLGVPVLLGSATPSLESWQRADTGRYRRLTLASRVGGGEMPRVRIVDLRALPSAAPHAAPLAPALHAALRERLERGEQSLVLLNRRGYAPVLHCDACGWKSACPHCSAYRVFHKIDRSLRCHHCGLAERVPRACPDCGNLDIAPVGRGTEKLEEQLGALLPGARIVRIDADSTRGAGTLQERFAAVHAGEVDVLVGTQMIAKGQDFRRVTLVAAVNPDTQLFASDFRAPERLFALLMQAGGRAGRDAAAAARSELWIQTAYPQHPLYADLRAHDVAAFARRELAARRRAGLPPYTSLALLRAEAKDAAVATAFLRDAAAAAGSGGRVTVYPPVPPPLSRVAGVERMQMLVEAASRSALQQMLAQWQLPLHALGRRHPRLLRWAIDVDPLAI